MAGKGKNPAAEAGLFSCLKCGDCCRWPGHVWLTPEDIARLAAREGLAETEWIERHAELTRNRAGLSLREKPDGSCLYLSDGRCAVYEDRPRQCRDFPGNWEVSTPCPGQAVPPDNKTPPGSFTGGRPARSPGGETS